MFLIRSVSKAGLIRAGASLHQQTGRILPRETAQAPRSDRSWVASPPPAPRPHRRLFSIDIVFFYANHDENEIKESQHFPHHLCGPAAEVGEPLLRHRMDSRDSAHRLGIGHLMFNVGFT